jgi:hypothetical protein
VDSPNSSAIPRRYADALLLVKNFNSILIRVFDVINESSTPEIFEAEFTKRN